MNNCLRLASLVVVLTGCSGGSSAIVDTLRYAADLVGHDAATPRLSPEFSYLRVTVDGRVLFLARGSIDADPHGPIEVWYSSKREVIRLQSGRIVGAAGTTAEWRNVQIPSLPSWSTLAASHEFKWTRVRDVMPGYRLGVNDSLVTAVIEPPRKSALLGVDPKSLTWFEERSPGDFAETRNGAGASEALPPARYGVAFSNGEEVVIYGEQCLAPAFCFTWQRWPARSSTDDKK